MLHACSSFAPSAEDKAEWFVCASRWALQAVDLASHNLPLSLSGRVRSALVVACLALGQALQTASTVWFVCMQEDVAGAAQQPVHCAIFYRIACVVRLLSLRSPQA